jgi:hypothetical protein
LEDQTPIRPRPGICGVCTHPRKHQIEIGLTYGLPVRVLAKRFGLSMHAVWRHSKNHLSPQLRAAILVAQAPSEIDLEELRKSEAEGLLSHLVSQRARLQRLSELALETGSVSGVCSVEGRITANLELVARLLDQLTVHHTVEHRSVLVSPDYLRLRQVLVEALRPFPVAMAAVSAALHRLENEAAADIRAKANGGTSGLGNSKGPLVIEHQPEAPQ